MRIAMMAATVLLLTACQSDKGLGPHHAGDPVEAPDCRGAGAGVNTDNCTILVNIERATDGSCTVSVQPDQDTVVFRGVRDKWILWQIDKNPGGYRFANKGIEFKNDSGNNFKNGRAVANGQVFRWKNGGDVGSYKYWVRVAPKSGLPCSLDPIIKNEA
jgi:hypothetical protein